jgi:hypothetical protein
MPSVTYLESDGSRLVYGDFENHPNAVIFRDASASVCVFGAPSGDAIAFDVGTTRLMTLSSGGSLTLSASVDSAAVADEVSIGRFEIGAGNTVLALSQETTVVTEVDETKFSHKVQMQINGTAYFVMLTAT